MPSLKQVFEARLADRDEDSSAASSVAITDGRPAAQQDDPLVQRLRAVLSEARQQWPGLDVSDEAFVSHLAHRLKGETDHYAALNDLHPADLYLACGCALGSRKAIDAFRDHYGATVDAAMKRVRLDDTARDELRQQIFERLLLGRGQMPPALALYSGRGELKNYLRVLVVREGLRLVSRRPKSTPEHSLESAARELARDDPELEVFKQRYGAVFKQAFRTAIASLDNADRSLLRFHYVESLTTRQISAITGGSSSTVTRRLAQARSAVLISTRDEMMRRLGISRSEFRSLFNVLESQLDIRLTTALRTKP